MLEIKYRGGSLLPWVVFYKAKQASTKTFMVKRFRNKEKAQAFKKENARVIFQEPIGKSKTFHTIFEFLTHHATVAAGLALAVIATKALGIY